MGAGLAVEEVPRALRDRNVLLTRENDFNIEASGYHAWLWAIISSNAPNTP